MDRAMWSYKMHNYSKVETVRRTDTEKSFAISAE